MQYEACLVTRGFKDTSNYKNYNLDEVYTPTTMVSTVRGLVNIATVNEWDLRHVDVNNAFLNGKVNRTILLKNPLGINENESVYYLLKKSIYGFKNS